MMCHFIWVGFRWAGSSLISYVKPWVFGGMIIEDNPIKYNSIPINAAVQYYKTAKYQQRSWDQQENRNQESTKSSAPVGIQSFAF